MSSNAQNPEKKRADAAQAERLKQRVNQYLLQQAEVLRPKIQQQRQKLSELILLKSQLANTVHQQEAELSKMQCLHDRIMGEANKLREEYNQLMFYEQAIYGKGEIDDQLAQAITEYAAATEMI